MFNQRVPRAESPLGTSILRKSTAIVGTFGLVGGLLLATPVAAQAAPHASFAQGHFLSGSLAGIDLARIVSLTPATARNNGTQTPQETTDPLAVSLVGSSPISMGAVRVSPDDVIDTSTSGGALSQYARAERTGAIGASGTVGKGGAIGPNASNPEGAFTLSLDTLINDSFSSVLADLKLEMQAVAAQAKGTAQSMTGDYFLNGLTLSFTSPTLAGLSATVKNAIGAVDGKLASLTGPNGELAVALAGILRAANPALSLIGSADAAVSLSVDLQAAVADLLTATYGGAGVSFNLTTGKVTVDLEKLVGGDLNNRPVGSEILTDATVTRMVSTIASSVSGIAEQVLSRVTLALETARLDVDGDLTLLTDQAPILSEICQYRDATGKLLGEQLGKLLGKLVCTTTTTPLPKLETSVSVDVHGTVAQVLNGQAPTAITAKVLGAPVTISTSRLLSALGLELGDRLFGSSGVVATLTGLLDGPLLAQANRGLIGSTSVSTVLSDLLSIRVNLQETTLHGGGMAVAGNTLFTQTALRVAVVGEAGSGGLTTLNIAAASVAPIVTESVQPGGPGGSDDPGTPGTPGNPDELGDNVATPSATGPDSLAFTGAGIATLAAMLLALLATGAYLMREGYRRNHPPFLP